MARSKSEEYSRRNAINREASVTSGSSSQPTDFSIVGSTLTLRPSGLEASGSRVSTAANTGQAHLHSSSGAGNNPSSGSQEDSSRNLISQTSRLRERPLTFMNELSLFYSGIGWRAYDEIVGQPCFYPRFSDDMKARVLSNDLLRGKIAELAKKRVLTERKEGLLCGNTALAKSVIDEHMQRRRREIEGQVFEVVDDIVDKMICKMDSKPFIRGAYYMCTSFLTRTFHQGIHVSSDEVLRLRDVASEAAKRHHSIIFLPNHKSHVDYVSLQIICFRLGISLPTVVAGDNLNFPVVGTFLQHAGAMWIRRSFGGDELYTTVVQAYMDTLLQNGYNFECFIEGGRSRTGKSLGPKFGILRFVMDGILSGRISDAMVCPVSTQYDKVVEVDSYVSELLGQPKPKENLMDFLSASSILNLKLGRVDVRFHEPWSLRGFCETQLAKYVGVPDLLTPNGTQWTEERRVRLLRTLGYKVLADINSVSVIMPTALIGTVLLTLRGRGVGKSELIRRVEWLSERIKTQGGRVAHFAGLPTEVVVARGLEVLGPSLVGVLNDGAVAEDTYYAVDRFQLSFYRNMTIHLFILEALVSAALYSRVKLGGAAEDQAMPIAELREHVFFLSQLFRGEFIFPTDGLDNNLNRALTSLAAAGVLHVVRDISGQVTYIQLSQEERDSGRENYDFYCFLIWPFIESIWLGAVSLMMLARGGPGAAFDMKIIQNRAQVLGKTLFHQGDLDYFEAVNTETLRNAYSRFEDEGIITVSQAVRDNSQKLPTTVRLAPGWEPTRCPITARILPTGKLWIFAERISLSRREGKNRRDGQTVERRILKLVDLVGQDLVDVGGRGIVLANGQPSSSEASSSKTKVGSDATKATRSARRVALGEAASKL